MRHAIAHVYLGTCLEWLKVVLRIRLQASNLAKCLTALGIKMAVITGKNCNV